MDEYILGKLGYNIEPIPSTLRLIVNFTVRNHQLVTKETIATSWLRVHSQRCDNLADLDLTLLVSATAHCLWIMSRDITCNDVNLSCEYWLLNNDIFPIEEELETLVQNRSLMLSDPDMYHYANKVIFATPNLEELPRANVPHLTECAICQGTISKNSEAFQVPCCKNYFHSVTSECINGKTVIDWLKTSKKCPVCNMSVIIEKHVVTSTLIKKRNQKRKVR